MIFFLFLLGEKVLTSTHNLYFVAKIRKICIPLHTPVLLHKSGVQGEYTLHGHVFVMDYVNVCTISSNFAVIFIFALELALRPLSIQSVHEKTNNLGL